MRSRFVLAALASAAAVSPPALAGDDEGKVQVKLLATVVLPDGEISDVNSDLVGLPAGTPTEADDNFVPTLAIEYFFTPAISLETICCLTQHDVYAVSGLPDGAELVSDAQIIPATFTLKYHFDLGGVTPYLGAGPTYFLVLDADPGQRPCRSALPIPICRANWVLRCKQASTCRSTTAALRSVSMPSGTSSARPRAGTSVQPR